MSRFTTKDALRYGGIIWSIIGAVIDNNGYVELMHNIISVLLAFAMFFATRPPRVSG